MVRRSSGLSERHTKILSFLETFQEEFGYSPSIRQIGERIGVKSTSLVDYYLNQLATMGFIERDDHVSRSIRILKATQAKTIPIPILGRIFASKPIPVPTSDFNYFDPENSIDVARNLLPKRDGSGDLFALEVQGDSMIDAMINEGDIVIMKQAQDATNGEMVAVWLNDTNETTLKYFYKEKDRVRLQPANPNMGPIYIENPQHLRIMGKVVMVIRQITGRLPDISPTAA